MFLKSMRDEKRRPVKNPAVRLHSGCYVTQHLKNGPLPVSAPLRHLHGHCVVCYTIEGWLVFIMVVSAGTERTVLIVSSRVLDTCLSLKSLMISNAHLDARSTVEAPETLGICRLAVADSFKAEDGTLPRVRGMWRPARLVAVGTLRQMLLPMRT